MPRYGIASAPWFYGRLLPSGYRCGALMRVTATGYRCPRCKTETERTPS